MVEVVDRLANEREDAHDLVDDVDAFGFCRSGDGVGDDVERSVEDGSRLLERRNKVSTSGNARKQRAYPSSNRSSVDRRDGPSLEASE